MYDLPHLRFPRQVPNVNEIHPIAQVQDLLVVYEADGISITTAL